MGVMKELAWQIAETSHAMRRFYDRRVAQLGVTRAQWRVIAILGHNPGMKQVELADRLDVEPISTCRIIDRLEEAGLVERQRDPADRRAWRLALTEKAQPIRERLSELAEEMSLEAFAGLSGEEIETISAALARVRDNIARRDDARQVTA
jgi:DNA-binding MarR family transcriptional regulator